MSTVDGAQRAHDVVIFGATGFVGRLTAAHLALRAPTHLRVALAGRSRERLDAVRSALGSTAADWSLIVADAADDGSVRRLAASTRVVATTVGPYSRLGRPLVAACIDAGTDYADLSAGVLFVRETLQLHQQAQAAGVRVVHGCGFDSVPSDLGVLLLHERVSRDGAGELRETVMLIESAKGGVSGGTIESFRTQVDAVRADRSLRQVLADPYSLSPDRGAEPCTGAQADQRGARRDPLVGAWTAPFVTGPYNARIVRRSNALLGFCYGRGFSYREAVAVRRGAFTPLAAGALSVGQRSFASAMAFRPFRALLDQVLPRPGSGPSEKARQAGHFRMQIHAATSTEKRYVATIAGSRDPGYGSTAVMLAESALCLALDRDETPQRGGVLTPATALGGPLAARLVAVGIEITVTEHRLARRSPLPTNFPSGDGSTSVGASCVASPR